MWNRELKHRISELEKKVSEAEARLSIQIRENNRLRHELQNPPKYKVGDKIGDLIVTKRTLCPFAESYITEVMRWAVIDYFGRKTGRKPGVEIKSGPPEAIKYWQYELVNVNNGSTLTKKESELSLCDIKLQAQKKKTSRKIRV
jgi:hypothetical protein